MNKHKRQLFQDIAIMIMGILLAFFLAKTGIIQDILAFFGKLRRKQPSLSRVERFRRAFRTQAFRWTAVILGSLIVASPLPDEIGLAIMGVSKIRTTPLLFISFLLNSAGIFVISALARAF